MKTITVAELRQNPTAALDEVEGGQTYVVTRHRRPIAQLIPVTAEVVTIVPPQPGQAVTRLSDRPRDHLHEYADTEELLREMSSDW